MRSNPTKWNRRLFAGGIRWIVWPLLIPIALTRGQRLANVRDFTRQLLAARTRTALSLIQDKDTAAKLAPIHSSTIVG